MIRDLGEFTPRRPHRLDLPILGMLFNGLHDRHGGHVFVLHIGAGNGEAGLPLLSRFRNDGWSGLLIEPLPRNFAQLEALHADSERVAVLNLGISDVSASQALHAINPDTEIGARRIALGRASLSRDRIASAGADDIGTVDVPCLRLDTVLSELGIDSAQLVVLNAGGHEAQALSSFDVAALDLSLILIHCAPGTPAEETCAAVLVSAGLNPFRIAGWLVGLAPDRLTIPLEELLTFFGKGIGAAAEEEE